MNVLAIGAHPDDVEFYCAGTLLKYARDGHHVFIALTTSGNIGSNVIEGREEIARTREAEQLEAAKLYAAAGGAGGGSGGGPGAKVRFLRNDDEGLQDTPELRRALIDAIRWAAPEVIFTHFPGDMSTDHNVTGTVVGRVLLSLPGKNVPAREPPLAKAPSLFYWDTAAGVHFEPEVYVDISTTIDDKLKALALHRSQFAWMTAFQGISLTEHSRTCESDPGADCI